MRNEITLNDKKIFYIANNLEGNMSLRDNLDESKSRIKSKITDVFLFIILLLVLWFALGIILGAQTWNRYTEGTYSILSLGCSTNLYSWGDTTYVIYDSTSYSVHLTKMIPGQAWRRWGNYYDGTGDGRFTYGGGIARLGNKIIAVGGATANSSYGQYAASYQMKYDGTTVQILGTTAIARGFSVGTPNADSIYSLEGAIYASKSADGVSFTQLESAKSFRTLLGTATGEYGQSLFYYNDTLWIGLARNAFTEASNNPVPDTGRVIYYVPAKGKYYVLNRSITGTATVKSIKWMNMYKGSLYILVDASDDKKGLWKREGLNFVHIDTPFDSTANVFPIAMTGDNDRRLYISTGRYGVMDTTWNRVWELRNGVWKKLNKIYSYAGGKTDSVVCSHFLHFNVNNNVLWAITPFSNSYPYLRAETDGFNQHKFYDAGGIALWYTDVGALESIELTNPVGGETFNANSSTTIEWTSTGIDEFKVYYTANGTDYTLLTTTGNNSYGWTIPENDVTTAKIRVTNTDSTIMSTSEAFTIRYSITLTNPEGGETYNGYDTVVVAWSDYGVDTAKVYFAINGTDYTLLTTTVSNTYSWAVPSIATVAAKIKITDTVNAINDESNAFTITKIFLRSCFIKPN